MNKKLTDILKKEYSVSKNKNDFLNEIKTWIHKNISNHKEQPVDNVMWIPLDKVVANDYNPNSVAETEMRLLYISIYHDGYTQPIVVIYDEKEDKYVVVDGFHRYLIMKTYKDIYEKNEGKMPCVVIKKDITERMASTIRHNRARGKHSVGGMSNLVFNMLDNGMTDEEVCRELGMEPDELLRLKHITGFSKLFKDIEYSKAWETKRQIRIRKDWNDGDKEVTIKPRKAILEKSEKHR
jgi:hypothetical protein